MRASPKNQAQSTTSNNKIYQASCVAYRCLHETLSIVLCTFGCVFCGAECGWNNPNKIWQKQTNTSSLMLKGYWHQPFCTGENISPKIRNLEAKWIWRVFSIITSEKPKIVKIARFVYLVSSQWVCSHKYKRLIKNDVLHIWSIARFG
jgi:hypothetical protein